MKQLGGLILVFLVLSSCESKHSKDYISISGKFVNNTDSLLYITGFAVKKTILIAKDGSFQDTLKVSKPDFYSMSTNRGKRGFLYLKNGYDLTLNGDGNEFFKSFMYEGNDEGADSNNLMVDRYRFAAETGTSEDFFLLEKQAFLERVNHSKKGLDSIAKLYKNANQKMVETSDSQNETYFQGLLKNYDRAHPVVVKKYEILAKLEKGKPAPEFTNFEDYNGGTKSLKDFRGKYVYIDVWATWCRPCIAQFPYLKKLEEEYQGKNISFVSISTDAARRSGGSWETAHKKWKTMVKEKELKGTQLWAGKQELNFSRNYLVEILPKFILIDPEGNIVDSNTYRPFAPELKQLFTSLGIK